MAGSGGGDLPRGPRSKAAVSSTTARLAILRATEEENKRKWSEEGKAKETNEGGNGKTIKRKGKEGKGAGTAKAYRARLAGISVDDSRNCGAQQSNSNVPCCFNDTMISVSRLS